MRALQGFTLIEVLIAITITALLGTGAFMLLNQALRNKQVLDEKSALLEALQKTDRLLAADLSGLVDRAIRDSYGMQMPALTTGNTRNLLEFTRTGWRDSATLLQEMTGDDIVVRRSALQRVAYRLEDEVLYRDFWGVMDQAQDAEPVTQLLLTEVLQFRIRFLDASNSWSSEWPPLSTGNPEAPPSPLPRGVEVLLEHARFGEIRRLFPVASGVVPPTPPSGAGSGTAGGGEI
jgi:general secretion pathway protein J